MTEWSSLDPKARWLFYVQASSRLLLVWCPASLMLALGVGATSSPVVGFAAGSLLFLTMFLLAVWYPSLAFERWSYAVTEEEVLIARGVLTRHVTAIPLGRVQHVDTRQGVLEQWMGLARLQIFTASGIGGDGVVPGLALEEAERLRDRLVRASEGQDGV